MQGGSFKCVAENYLGKEERTARMNVMGPPLVRPMEDMSFVAGTDVWVHCPYSGYPIKEILWSKKGKKILNQFTWSEDCGLKRLCFVVFIFL